MIINVSDTILLYNEVNDYVKLLHKQFLKKPLTDTLLLEAQSRLNNRLRQKCMQIGLNNVNPYVIISVIDKRNILVQDIKLDFNITE